VDVEAERRAVLAAFDASQAALLGAIDGLTEAQLAEPSLDGWSVKDHLTHLAQWHELRWLDLTRLAAGYESAVNSTPEQDEAFNAMTVAWRAGLSWQQTLWEWQTARGRVVETVRTLPADELALALRDDWPLRTGHESEHAGYIRTWRETLT
jgi:uncharacterized damage-inducible protein DinB